MMDVFPSLSGRILGRRNREDARRQGAELDSAPAARGKVGGWRGSKGQKEGES